MKQITSFQSPSDLLEHLKDSPRELEAIHTSRIAGKDATIKDLQQQVKTNERELLQQTNVYCEVLKTNETLENQLESANSAKLELKLKLELEIEHARRNEFEIEQARNFEIEIEHTQLFLDSIFSTICTIDHSWMDRSRDSR